MEWIGRKLYIDWGNMVLAFEKLPAIRKSEIPFEQPAGDKCMKTYLVDVFDCGGQRIEKRVNGTRIPVMDLGYTVDRYITDTNHWVTVEECETDSKRLDANADKISSGGTLGDAEVFHIGRNISAKIRDDIQEWAKPHKSLAVIHSNSIWIFDKKLAIEFRLKF